MSNFGTSSYQSTSPTKPSSSSASALGQVRPANARAGATQNLPTPLRVGQTRFRLGETPSRHQSYNENPATRHRHVNVGEAERWISTLVGGGMFLWGLRSGRLSGYALAAGGAALLHRGVTGHCMTYEAMGIRTAPSHNPQTSVAAGKGIKAQRTFTVNVEPAQAYQFWRDFKNLPSFMTHLESVTDKGDGRSHWVAKGPVGMQVHWDAEIIIDRPNEMISWRSLEGSQIDNAGSVHFRAAPGGRGTEVTVSIRYDLPGGKLTSAIVHMIGQAPEQLIYEDLRRFKQLLEAGEAPTVEGQPRGQSKWNLIGRQAK